MVEDPTTCSSKLRTKSLLFPRGFQAILKGLFGSHADYDILLISGKSRNFCEKSDLTKINFGAFLDRP